MPFPRRTVEQANDSAAASLSPAELADFATATQRYYLTRRLHEECRIESHYRDWCTAQNVPCVRLIIGDRVASLQCDPGTTFTRFGYTFQLDMATRRKVFDILIAHCVEDGWNVSGNVNGFVANGFPREVAHTLVAQILDVIRPFFVPHRLKFLGDDTEHRSKPVSPGTSPKHGS